MLYRLYNVYVHCTYTKIFWKSSFDFCFNNNNSSTEREKTFRVLLNYKNCQKHYRRTVCNVRILNEAKSIEIWHYVIIGDHIRKKNTGHFFFTTNKRKRIKNEKRCITYNRKNCFYLLFLKK